MNKVGLVYHPQYLEHQTSPGHPERPDRLRAIVEHLKKTQLDSKMIALPVKKASVEQIAWVHDPTYIESVAKIVEQGGGYLDADTVVSSGSFEAALLAAGGLLAAVEQVQAGEVEKALALVRPPGHHAERDHAMGFCLFNNVAVAAEYLIRQHGLKRVAIVDFDVHHGNATQHMFYDRNDIFYLSTHRYPFYPGTGAASETGSGAGAGYTLNFPMPAGCGDAEYSQVFKDKLIPALRKYQPEFLLVSAGFDAHRLDPLGGMMVTSKGFAWMTEALEKVAQDFCGGKSVYVLEGGYDLVGLAQSVEEVSKVLLNLKEKS